MRTGNRRPAETARESPGPPVTPESRQRIAAAVVVQPPARRCSVAVPVATVRDGCSPAWRRVMASPLPGSSFAAQAIPAAGANSPRSAAPFQTTPAPCNLSFRPCAVGALLRCPCYLRTARRCKATDRGRESWKPRSPDERDSGTPEVKRGLATEIAGLNTPDKNEDMFKRRPRDYVSPFGSQPEVVRRGDGVVWFDIDCRAVDSGFGSLGSVHPMGIRTRTD